MGDDRPITYLEEIEGSPVVIYRASSIGGCETCLVASRLGYEPIPHNEQTLENFAKGNKAEPIILDWLVEHGWNISDTQAEIQLRILPGIIIRGHNDAIGRHSDELADKELIECKWMGPSVYKKWVSGGWNNFDNYQWQSDIYCHGLGLANKRLAIATAPLDDGDELLIVVSPSFPTHYSLGAIRKRILTIEKYVKLGEVPTISPHYPCPYYYLREDKTTTASTSTNRELDDLIGRIAYNTAEVREHEARIKLMRQEVITIMERDKLGDKCTTANGTASITRRTTIAYKKACDDNNINLDNYKSVSAPSVTITPSKTATLPGG